MTVNKKIENALSSLVNGKIYPLVCPIEEKPNEYITYNQIDTPADFGDSKALNYWTSVEVHWAKKSANLAAANYVKARKDIRRALINAGFIITEIFVNYDRASGYTYMTMTAEIEEEDFYG